MIATLVALQLLGTAGLEFAANEPYVTRRGAHVGAELRMNDWFGLSALAGAYPNMGKLDQTRAYKNLVQIGLRPIESRVVGRERLAAHLYALRAKVDTFSAAMGVFAGAGLVQTVDGVPNPHHKQSHIAFAWGLTAEMVHQHVGVRLRAEETRYQENVGSRADSESPLWLGAELVIRR
jgi:hypothetical protein